MTERRWGQTAMRPRADVPPPSRGRVISIAILLATLVSAIPPLSLVYSGGDLVTFYGVVFLALACQFAEWWDERTGRLDELDRQAGLMRLFSGSTSLQAVMMGIVVLIVGYFLLVGLAEIADGLSGGTLTAGADVSASDKLAAGALTTGASMLCLLAYAVGTERVPGLRGLRPRCAISWLAVAVVLLAIAQNLSPQSAAQGVASTLAKPVTASDLIVGSLPFGVIAILVIGPAVRRTAVECLERLGLLPLRLGWGAVGFVAGLLLVPVTDALFPSPAAPGQGPAIDASRFLAGGLAAAVVLVVLTSPRLREPMPWLPALPGMGRLGGGGTLGVALRWVALVGGLLLIALAVAEVFGHLAAAMPADCVAQQQQVTQNLEGGDAGRPWLGNLGIAAAAATDEELIFRGAVQLRFGLVMTSVLFASYHLQYTCHGAPSLGDLEILVLGLAFGLLRNRGGLLAAIAAHGAYDGSLLLGHHL